MTFVRPLALTLLALLFLAPSGRAAASGETCLECHREKTPAAVRAWQASAHAGKAGCSDCHGTDHQAMLAGTAPVTVQACAPCHPRATAGHRASRHGLGLHSGWGCTRNETPKDPASCAFCHDSGSAKPLSTVQCARFLKQSPAMREIGCNRCHQVERSCAVCHGAHTTDLAIVRAPQVCAKCHMGPDHPQWEMWQTSRHGSLATTAAGLGATCQDCHMADGDHDVSRGITATPGQAPLPDAARRRAAMLAVCERCHARGFASRDLDRADQVRSESRALVEQGEQILKALAAENLLDPSLTERPPHPLRRSELVTDGQMLYEDISHAERLFFKMKKYDLAKTVKGAYHQNPAYSHWYGNAELKMDLVDLQAEASRLRGRPSAATAGTPDPAERTAAALKRLKSRYASGELSAAAYREGKKRLLDRFRAPPSPPAAPTDR